jgi:RNA-binding protein YhbY
VLQPIQHRKIAQQIIFHTETSTILQFSDNVDTFYENPSETARELSALERTWRSVKKPMVRIGSKGTALSHGNSLRELLNAHTVVKVKVNNSRIPLEETFAELKKFAVQSGASQGIELIQARDKDKIILVGLPGTLEKIENGSFPPPPVEAESS